MARSLKLRQPFKTGARLSTTTLDLIASIKRRALIPTSQSTFQLTDLLLFADDSLQTRILPLIMRHREEFFLTSETTTTIPERAIGGKMESVELVYPDGQSHPIGRLEPHADAFGFTIRNSQIIVKKKPESAKVRINYFIRPNKLVLPVAARKIESVNAQSITANACCKFLEGENFDIINSQPIFEHKAIDIPATLHQDTKRLINVESVTSIGDWISLAGTSPVPQIPLEFFPILAQSVAVTVLEALGFSDKAAAAERKLEKMEKDIVNIITPRVDGSRRRIINKNSLLGLV